MWFVSGVFPGLMPRSHDSVPHKMSGLVYWSTVASSCVFWVTDWQLTVIMRRFDFGGKSNTDEEQDLAGLDDSLLVFRGLRVGDGVKEVLGVLASCGVKGLEEETVSVLDSDWRGAK